MTFILYYLCASAFSIVVIFSIMAYEMWQENRVDNSTVDAIVIEVVVEEIG